MTRGWKKRVEHEVRQNDLLSGPRIVAIHRCGLLARLHAWMIHGYVTTTTVFH